MKKHKENNSEESVEYFIDEDFPHTNESLLHKEGEKSDESNNDIEWLRIEEIIENPELFGEISPNDINQGGIGNCWIISAIAALAEFPDLIQNLFITQEIPEDGKYELQLFDIRSNEWVNVIIDSYVPCSDRSPIYASSNNNKLWPLLLEKAIAKFCGTYNNIGELITGVVFPNLTGMTTLFFGRIDPEVTNRWCRCTHTYDFKSGINQVDHTDEEYNLEELFNLLVEHNENEDIMKCSAYLYKIESDARGINGSHEYSLIEAAQVDDFKLLKLRNPWGYGEWEGDWCDTSELWEEYPAVKEALEFEPVEDGSFWITIEDFSKRFGDVTICLRNEDITDNSDENTEDNSDEDTNEESEENFTRSSRKL